MNRPMSQDMRAATPLQDALATVGALILGKESRIKLAFACLLARGHLLIEDLPGVGKTTLAQALARTLGLDYSRVQFTSDLLPTDILGVSLYDAANAEFEFHPGPVFAQLVLADEVNRASPKTQSALLEAMEERQVTIDGATRTLPEPFFVIATQNPADHAGTFPLPESQLDRFLMRIDLGYPPADAERALLSERSRRELLAEQRPVMTAEDVIELQAAVDRIRVSDALLDYLLDLIRQSRESGAFLQGLSPRAGLALRRAAQAWAMLEDRDYVLPEDVQAVLPAVVDHRLQPADGEPAATPPSTRLREAVAIP
ncbi:ATPase [Salinisphaera sp. PC39]|uniref:AAA family ATPase n=1 Tax=Salinisphaera sp. PC39 TaxID=1304156 RepID=UPI00333E9732